MTPLESKQIVPNNPKIFHITHVGNLPGIIKAGCLWSDFKRKELGFDCDNIGMSTIKERRLTLPLECLSGTTIGQYVPFYFCPRSVMLYIFHMNNHVDLTYRGGQDPIIHLQMDMHTAINYTKKNNNKRWAFTDGNAAAYYTESYNDLDKLSEINWEAVNASGFRDTKIKEGKQAEFLIYESTPWSLVEKIGAINPGIETQVGDYLTQSDHKPKISVESSWYF